MVLLIDKKRPCLCHTFIQHFVIRILCFSYLQSIISGSFCMFRFHTFVHLVYGKWEKEVTYNQNVCQTKIFCLQCIYRLRCLRSGQNVTLRPFSLVLHAPYHTPQFFRIGRNALGTAVVVYLFYKTDLSRHLVLLFIDYLCSKYISEQHMTTNLNPIHNLIVQHPFATVLTVAFCLIVCLPLLLYIITKITALIKFFKGK